MLKLCLVFLLFFAFISAFSQTKKVSRRPSEYSKMMQLLCKTITNTKVDFDSIKCRLIIPFRLCNEQTEQRWDSAGNQWVQIPMRELCSYERIFVDTTITPSFITRIIDSSFYCKKYTGLPSVTFYSKMKTKTAIEIIFSEIENKYDKDDSKAESGFNDEIYFADLIKIFGAPKRTIKEFNRYYSIFKYKNPLTGNFAELLVESFFLPYSKRNNIFNLTIRSFQNK